MERHILKNEAQSHIDAYLEYRMLVFLYFSFFTEFRIVGDRDNGQLLPEKEYEKLRKEFYEKRDQHGTHFVNTGFLRNPTRQRRALDGTKARTGEDIKTTKNQLPGRKGSRVIDTSVTPYELINR